MKERTLAKEILVAGTPIERRYLWAKEFEADAFAEALLMPEEPLLDRFKKVFRQTKNVPLTCRILAKLFQVEYFRVVRRLTRLNAI